MRFDDRFLDGLNRILDGVEASIANAFLEKVRAAVGQMTVGDPRDPATRVGPLMGAFDIFEIVATGKGAHAAMPYDSKDPMLFAAHAINALQTIVSRNIHPQDAGVVSVTQVHGGDTWNVIPQEVVLRGTVRAFKPEVQDLIERRMRGIVAGVAATFEMTATVRYERRYPATVNEEAATKHAIAAAAAVVGAANVDTDPTPELGSEDFSFMLQAKPGAFARLGQGGAEGGCFLHNSKYDFNDAVIPLGAGYLAALAESAMPLAGSPCATIAYAVSQATAGEVVSIGTGSFAGGVVVAHFLGGGDAAVDDVLAVVAGVVPAAWRLDDGAGRASGGRPRAGRGHRRRGGECGDRRGRRHPDHDGDGRQGRDRKSVV